MRLYEFSDRELLWILHDVADKEGVIRAKDVARQIGITHKRPTQCVGGRLARLRQLGVVEKVTQGKWRLTDRGEALMRGKLRASQANMLDTLDDTSLYAMVPAITQR